MRWPWRRDREQDLEREIRSHLELEASDQRESGLSAEEAHHAARRAFGNSVLVKEDVRQLWSWTRVESVLQDLRFGSRILTKSPGITGAVVVSLALGFGATTGLFSLLNALLFKTLPVPDPQTLVVLQRGTGADLDDFFTYPQLAALRESAKGTVNLFGYAGGAKGRLQYAEQDRSVQVHFVSGDFFRIVRIQPFLGRLLQPADDVPGSASATAAVISYRLWQSVFHGDPSVIGSKFLLDSAPCIIAGVTPRTYFGMRVGGDVDVTLPFASKLAVSPHFKLLDCKACYWLQVMGRLKPDNGGNKARAALNVIWKNVLRATIPEDLPARYKTDYLSDRIALAPGATGLSAMRSQFSKPLYVLLGMTMVILLISCSNVANLLLARALGRQREMAVRLSVGARRGRLVRQLLTESALLAAVSLLASVSVYLLCVHGLLRFLESGGQQVFLDTSPDLRVAAFVAASTLSTLALFGLTPAFRATRCRLSGSLAESAQSVTGRSRLSRLIFSGQLALSFSLVVAAILLARSLYDLRTFNAGFRRDHVLLISPDTSSASLNANDQRRQIEAALANIRTLPGVRSASASVVIPIEGSSWRRDITTPGYAPRGKAEYACYENMITPDFFRTTGTRILLGRDFTERDNEVGLKVAVVNESFARRYWGQESPLGKQFHEVEKLELVTVVGVVADAKYRDFRSAAPPTEYRPLKQMPITIGWNLHLQVWTQAEPHSLIPLARDLVNRHLKDVPVTYQTFTAMIDQQLLYERLLTVLSTAFGTLGILICAVGMYGLAAYSMNRRTAEIGLRMALGATPGAVLRLVFGEQVVLVIAGLGAGVVGALLLTGFLKTWLFGVSPTDIPTIVGSTVGLIAVVAIATLIPARRAARIEPLRALRHS